MSGHEIVSVLPWPCFVLDSNKKVVAWSRGVAALTGVQPDAACGEPAWRHFVDKFKQWPLTSSVQRGRVRAPFGEVELSAVPVSDGLLVSLQLLEPDNQAQISQQLADREAEVCRLSRDNAALEEQSLLAGSLRDAVVGLAGLQELSSAYIGSLRHLGEAFDLKAGALFLCSDDRATWDCSLPGAPALLQGLHGLSFGSGEGLIGSVLQQNCVLASPDTRTVTDRLGQLAAGGGLAGMIAVPLDVNGVVDGVLVFFRRAPFAQTADPVVETLNAVERILSLILDRLGKAAGLLKAEQLEDAVEQLLVVISSAARGDLDVTMPDVGDGTIGKLAAGIGELIDTVHSIFVDLNTCVDGLAEGRLDVSMSQEYRGDFARAAESFERALVGLNSLVSGTRDVADQLDAGAREVATGAVALAEGNAMQAAAVQEMRVTLSEISLSTRANASAAARLSTDSNRVGELAEGGDERMRRLLGAMDEIEVSSRSISKIIRVINDIAFQTKLLALNAAVEAARAGDAGRGFAVVANEVSGLANRCATAASQTTKLIESTTERVERGKELALSTAASLSEIVSHVNVVGSGVAGIADACGDQANSIEQVAEGVSQVDEVTQQNASLSHESAASSEEIVARIDELRQHLDGFTTRALAVDGGLSDEQRRSAFALFMAQYERAA